MIEAVFRGTRGRVGELTFKPGKTYLVAYEGQSASGRHWFIFQRNGRHARVPYASRGAFLANWDVGRLDTQMLWHSIVDSLIAIDSGKHK